MTLPHYTAKVRDIIAQYGRLSVDVTTLTPDTNLHFFGLTSLATVNVMLGLENHFDIEFPEAMLKRKTFESLQSIEEAVAELVGVRVEPP